MRCGRWCCEVIAVHSDGKHTPVLLNAAIAALQPCSNGLFVDCTFGRGGHSREILSQLSANGRVLGIDADPEAVLAGQQLAGADVRFEMAQGQFSGLAAAAAKAFGEPLVNGVLFDLGVSSPQLDEARRGFSFLRDGPLDMRMNPDVGLSAAEWLRQVGEQELIRVLRDYGEERYARRIARAILSEGERCPIETTGRLADVVKNATPGRERHKNPATRTFQALRIRVNDELEELAQGLREATNVLKAGGRLVVISFHSLEDRLVKRFIRDEQHPDSGPFAVPLDTAKPRLRAVGKLLRADEAECQANPRARSATLRVAERLV